MVEDDFGDVNLLKLVLARKTGYSVNIVKPWEAIAVNQQHHPKIIQLDSLEGACFKICSALKRDNPSADYLIYSANRSSEFLAQAREQGIRVFKKGDMGELINYVKTLNK